MMLRKTLLALAAIASIGLLAPDAASARGGGFGGGGHFGGGGGHFGGGGGFRGGYGGFRGGYGRGFGYGIGGFGLGVGLGYGLYGPYGPYGYYGGYGAPYSDGYYADEGGCYLVRRRVQTPYGWRIRRVEVCG
jgi:hypothetical protein